MDIWKVKESDVDDIARIYAEAFERPEGGH